MDVFHRVIGNAMLVPRYRVDWNNIGVLELSSYLSLPQEVGFVVIFGVGVNAGIVIFFEYYLTIEYGVGGGPYACVGSIVDNLGETRSA